MKLIVAGSRHFVDSNFSVLVFTAVDFIRVEHDITGIITGGAKGIDDFGKMYAETKNIEHMEINPDWSLGKKAGPLRNAVMAAEANALLLIWDGESRGSASMLREAKMQKLKIWQVVIHKEPTS